MGDTEDAAPTGGEGRGAAPRQHIAVALSGGGHRASLFAIGALLYLVDAGKGPELSTVSSISGGSITNGYVAATTDLTTAEPATFWRDMATLGKQVAAIGTIWASKLTYAFLGSIAFVLVAAVVLTVLIASPVAIVIWILALAIVGWLAQQRSWVARQSFERGIFHGRRLDSVHSTVSHVMCSADLQTAEHVYFSGRFVHSYRTGWGIPGDLPLATAVQASAALPGAFNVVSLPVGPHRFEKSPPFSSFKLTDGGVYDNMGTEWPVRLSRRLTEGKPPVLIADADELVVVNASAGLGITKRTSLRTPLLGELTTLLAVKDVLYDQTTSVRRRLLDLRFRVTRRHPDSALATMGGALAQIDASPYQLADQFARFGDDLGDRARAVIALLGGDDPEVRRRWDQIADASAGEKTALSKIPPDRAASLVRHAYVLTMANCHVLLEYDLVPIPDDARFRGLVS